MSEIPSLLKKSIRDAPLFSNPAYAAIFSLVVNISLSIILMLLGNHLNGDAKIYFLTACGVILVCLLLITVIAFLIYAPEYYCSVTREKAEIKRDKAEIKKKSHDGYDAVRVLSEDTKNYINDVSVHSIVMSTYSRELIFSDEILKSGICQLYTRMTLINLHEHNTYKKFKTRLASQDAISCREQYKVYKETNTGCEKIELTESNFKVYEHYQQSPTRKKNKIPDNWECIITIPVGIEPNTTYPLHIREDTCPSFKKLKEVSKKPEPLESISATVNYPTDELSFTIRLKDGELTDYVLGRGGQEDEDGDREAFKISDRSDQWLDHYCNRLKTRDYVPHYSEDNRTLTWIIPNPKRGFRYKLYFTLVKNTIKSPNNSQKQ